MIAANDPSLPAAQLTNSAPGAADYTLGDLQAELQTLQNPVPAQGNAMVSTVEDIQAEGRIKVAKARLMVDDLTWLQGQDMLTATRWMDIRPIQGQALSLTRPFGAPPTAAWQAFRTVVPWQAATPSGHPAGNAGIRLPLANPASMFYPAARNRRAPCRTRRSDEPAEGRRPSAKARTAKMQRKHAHSLHNHLLLQANTARKH